MAEDEGVYKQYFVKKPTIEQITRMSLSMLDDINLWDELDLIKLPKWWACCKIREQPFFHGIPWQNDIRHGTIKFRRPIPYMVRQSQ